MTAPAVEHPADLADIQRRRNDARTDGRSGTERGNEGSGQEGLGRTILATGVQYDNRFCSIIRIENRKIGHWRDYMDSLAAWNALTARAGR